MQNAEARGRLWLTGTVVGCACLILTLYGKDLWNLRHPDGEQFGLGLWAFAFSTALIWKQRELLRTRRMCPEPWALPMLILGLAVYLAAERTAEPFGVGISMPLVLLGLAWVLWGTEWLEILAVPLLFTVSAFPLPLAITALVAYPLQRFVAGVSGIVCGLIGLPTNCHGFMLRTGHTVLVIADVCSGLRSFTALLAAGVFVAYWTGHGEWRRIFRNVMVLIPLVIAGNIVRVTTLVVLAHTYGRQVIDSWVHDALGAGIATAVLLVFALRLLDRDTGISREKVCDGHLTDASAPELMTRFSAYGHRRFAWLAAATIALLALTAPTAIWAIRTPRTVALAARPPLPATIGSLRGKPADVDFVGPRPPRQTEFACREYGTGIDGGKVYVHCSRRGRASLLDLESLLTNKGFLVQQATTERVSSCQGVLCRTIIWQRGSQRLVTCYSYFNRETHSSGVSRVGYNIRMVLYRLRHGRNGEWTFLLAYATGSSSRVTRMVHWCQHAFVAAYQKGEPDATPPDRQPVRADS